MNRLLSRTRLQKAAMAPRMMALCVYLTLVVITPSAYAGDGDASDPSWQYRHGVQLADEGRFSEAIEAFQSAYQLRPHASVLYNLGQASVSLKKYADAHRYLQRYLADAGDLATPERKASVQAQLKQLEGATAAIRLEVNPAGSQVLLDDDVVGVSPLAHPLRLDPGTHQLTARKDGLISSTATVSVQAGESHPLHLVLIPMPQAKLAPDVGLLTVSCRATDAEVIVDGRRMFRSPGESSLALREGVHQVLFRKRAFPDAAQEVVIEALVTTAVTCPWVAPPTVSGSASAHDHSPKERRFVTAAKGLWVAGILLAAGAGGMALWNAERRDDWRQEDREPLSTTLTEEQSQSLTREHNRLGRSINTVDDWSLAMAIGAGASVVAGTTLYILGAKLSVGPDPRVALRFTW